MPAGSGIDRMPTISASTIRHANKKIVDREPRVNETQNGPKHSTKHHRALADAEAAGRILLAMMAHKGISTPRDLAAAVGVPLRRLDTLGSLSTIFLFAWRIVLAEMVGIRSMPLPAGIFRSDE